MDAERKIHLVCLWLQDNTNVMKRVAGEGKVFAIVDDPDGPGYETWEFEDTDLVEWFDDTVDKAATQNMCWSDAMAESWPEGEDCDLKPVGADGNLSANHPPLRDSDDDLWVWLDGEYHYVYADENEIVLGSTSRPLDDLEEQFGPMEPASIA